VVSGADGIQFTVATESQLDDLISGVPTTSSAYWDPVANTARIPPGATGFLWRHQSRPRDIARPLAVIAHEQDHRRLFGRLAQLRGDLSPLSAWCHVLVPRQLETLRGIERVADLGGLEAAWVGLIIAEAQLLSAKPVAKLRMAACMATQSFAVARSVSLWGHTSVNDVTDRFEATRRIIGSQESSRMHALLPVLQPVWTSLTSASGTPAGQGIKRPIAEAIRNLAAARNQPGSVEAMRLAVSLLDIVPEARPLVEFEHLSPEARLAFFDSLLAALREAGTSREPLRRTSISVLAGYTATVAAGGAPSLSLAEACASEFPEILAWAYTLGGVGEAVTWTSSFDGLGRLVARELCRPLRLDEAPTCDFSLDEAAVLADPQLADPLVYLKIKQARTVSVALAPGVNLTVSLSEAVAGERLHSSEQPSALRSRSAVAPSAITRGDMSWEDIADFLWPYLEQKIERIVRSSSGKRSGKKPQVSSQATDGNLPLYRSSRR
jgi:hypothetical protein